MADYGRRFVAELFGTFTLVFFGCGSVIAATYPGAGFGLLGIAVAHAIALSVAVTATMNISGGHLNPAVSFAFLLVRRINVPVFAVHLAAQLAAAVLAAMLLKGLFPPGAARVASYGLPGLQIGLSFTQGLMIEILLTLFLMWAIYGTAVAPSAPQVGGFGIGLTLLFLILSAGPLTGAAMNPARALAPAIASGNWTAQGLYWVGPAIGAVLAALVWEFVLIRKGGSAAAA